jgi:hypothetical protein
MDDVDFPAFLVLTTGGRASGGMRGPSRPVDSLKQRLAVRSGN